MSAVMTLALVAHMAKLANIPLSEEKIESLTPQLSSVLDLVSQVQQMDTNGVEETSQVTGLENVLREDIVEDSRTFTQEEALSNASRSHNGYFVVDALITE